MLIRALFVLILLLAPAAARALEPATTGLVILHGKWGNPGLLRDVGDGLAEQGYLVERPEMPWSGNRLFDRSYDQGQAEIMAAAARLTEKGARRVVIIGHSLGANAALAAAVRAPELAAVVLIAPGHFPEGRISAEKAADSVAKARAMVAAGEGQQTASFLSLNEGNRSRSVQAKAEDYLSFYAPDGPAAPSRFVSRLGATPILWLAAKFDPLTQLFETLIVPKFPPQARLEKVEVTANHMDAPQAGATALTAWLKALP